MPNELKIGSIYSEVSFVLPECFPDGKRADGVLNDLEDTIIKSFPQLSHTVEDFIIPDGDEWISEEAIRYRVLFDGTTRELERLKRIVLSSCKSLKQTHVNFTLPNGEVHILPV